MTISTLDRHANAEMMIDGASLEQAKAAVIMLHGRGASAKDILSLASYFAREEVTYLAPNAHGNSWYPHSFMADLVSNQPDLDSAFRLMNGIIERVRSAGIPPEATMIMGFSQGACLALEFAIRNAQRYGGIAALSGGLIGPEGMQWQYPGSLDGTPIYMGCSDVDPFIPLHRVRESMDMLQKMGADVALDIFPGMGHVVNEVEMEAVSKMIVSLG